MSGFKFFPFQTVRLHRPKKLGDEVSVVQAPPKVARLDRAAIFNNVVQGASHLSDKNLQLVGDLIQSLNEGSD